ncbi:MinD/ParA family protein [Clostridium frigidicarnis]|uniref:Flagellar biosynthesis protein FlhG n=1 Tax=Clostridium frigidicarnis TaxID=84698 RepID=A0A1I0VG68_9CLOT|nr:MinD/ParA family protein [Clostridium frigidicarnis]SFA74970.1 flagellar biosynthesis protein FlhG [Clostridium frigidicarnis]
MLDQAENLRKLAQGIEEKPKPKMITVTSGKGGVGKSNLVVNLAICLQNMGKRVMIFDADIGMGNDDILMGIVSDYNVFDVILNGMSINDVIKDGLYGVKLLAGGTGLNRVEDLDESKRKYFLKKLEEINDVDYILMDTGAGINRSVLAFIAAADETIVITTPEPTSMTDAYSLVKAISHFNLKSRISLVVNRVMDENEGNLTFNKFKSAVTRFLKVDIDLIGLIWEDRKVTMSVREQKPFVVGYPNCHASIDIKYIAKKIIGNTKNNNTGSGFKEVFKKIFNIFS